MRAAYFDRVSLSSTGYHATPDIGYDFKTNSGNPFNYFTYGVACSVVEIDCLTGDHQVQAPPYSVLFGLALCWPCWRWGSIMKQFKLQPPPLGQLVQKHGT